MATENERNFSRTVTRMWPDWNYESFRRQWQQL